MSSEQNKYHHVMKTAQQNAQNQKHMSTALARCKDLDRIKASADKQKARDRLERLFQR